MELRTYPRYMYHHDHNEPVRVDSKAAQTDKENLGWTTRYLHKEYPKWVGDKIVQSKAEHDRLLAAAKPPEEVVVSSAGQGSADSEGEIPLIDDLFEEEDPELLAVTKEIQVDGQDTAKIVEKSGKKPPGRPKKTAE